MTKGAIMRRGLIHIYPSKAFYNGSIRLKERPASSGYGTRKRNISEVLSDASLVPATLLAHHHEVT